MRQISKHRGFIKAMRTCVMVIAVVPMLAACGSVSEFINDNTKFSSKEYGVKASPRVTKGKKVPKGGGRKLVGKPYKVAGKWYTPKVDPNYDNTGAASWYGPNFHGRLTANGEVFDQFGLSAAHPTLPLPSYVRVTNLENNRSIVVRVNDRGPFVHGREIDLSQRAAEMLDYKNNGMTRVRVKYVGDAPLEGDDTRMLMASLNKPTQMERGFYSETRIAMADPVVASTRPQEVSPVRPVAAIERTASAAPVMVTPQGFNIVQTAPQPAPVPTGELGPLFYAETNFDARKADDTIDSAFAAAEAMATRPTELDAWKRAIDEDTRSVRIQLGVFSSKENVARVQEAFALIGAVDSADISRDGRTLSVLTLTQLKPGASTDDVVMTARELGLNDVVLY